MTERLVESPSFLQISHIDESRGEVVIWLSDLRQVRMCPELATKVAFRLNQYAVEAAREETKDRMRGAGKEAK